VERPQKTLCTKVKEKTKRGKDRLRNSELLTDERCSQAILDFTGSNGRWGHRRRRMKNAAMVRYAGGHHSEDGGSGNWEEAKE